MLTISVVSSFCVQAQTKIWDKTYGGSGSDAFESIKPTNDGGFILAGTSYSPVSGDKTGVAGGSGDYWVIKLNADGSKQWDKTFGGDNYDALQSVQQTLDGGYILGGYSFSGASGNKTEENEGGIDYWIVKLKSDGSKQWDKTFGGDNTDWLTTVELTPDGGYILGGYSSSTISGDKSEANKGDQNTYDYWVIKLNASGNKVWDKTLGGNHSDYLNALVATPDGGYLLGGSTSSDKSGDKSEPRNSDCTYGFDGDPCPDYWVVKISAQGAKQWDKTYDGYKSDFLTALAVTKDGGYLLGGTSESDESMDKSQPSRDATEDEAKGDYWVIKIKANGTKVWDRTFGGNNRDGLTALLATPDGGFLLGGYSNSSKNQDMTEARREVESYWVIKLNAQGNKIWDKALSNVNRYINSLSLGLALTEDGNCWVAGTSAGGKGWEKSQEPKGAEDFWVVKLDIPNKKVQTITFNPADQGLSSTPYTLLAKASSGLPVTFKLLSGPATQYGNQLKFTGYGTVVIKALQAGNATYSAVEHTTSFRVQRFTKLPDKTIGGDNIDLLADMVATPDGGYLLAGTSQSGKAGDKGSASKGASDYWLVKIDKNLKKVWDKSFGGEGTETLSIILATPDGGYLLGGSSDSDQTGDKSEPSRGAKDYWLVKTDADGNKQWDKTLGGNRDDNLTTIVVSPDGGYLLGGSSASDQGNDKSEGNKGTTNGNGDYTTDYWVIKVDSEGNKIWDKTLGNAYDDNLSAMLVLPNGNYVLGGYTDTDINEFTDFELVYLNSQGDLLWSKTYDRDWVDNLAAIAPTPDGGFLLTGMSGFETYYYWILKVNAKGEQVWERTYGGGDIFNCESCVTNRSTPTDIVVLPTGNYLIAGYTHSNIGSSRSEENRGRDDYWLLEIDENGQKIADKSFGSQGIDRLVSIIASPDGSYLLGGSSTSNIGYEKSENSKGNYDFWLVRTETHAFPPATLEAWNFRFGGSSHDYLTTMLPTADGGYLLGGYSYSNQSGDKTQGSRGKSDYWVVKTDPAGKKLWDKRYGGSGEDYLKSVVSTQDGGYLLGGSSESGLGGDKTQASNGSRDYWIIKINSSGQKEWDQSYGGQGVEDFKKIISLGNDNTYLLAGYSESAVSGDKTQGTRGGKDYWIIKIQGINGAKYWDKRFGGSGDDYLEDVLVLGNRDLLLGGTSFSAAGGDKSQGSRGNSDYWVVRTNSEGQKLWDKRYGGSGQDQLYALSTTATNAILLAGQSASGKGGEKSQNSQGGKDFWILQVDGQGKKQWDKTYGGAGEESLRSLILDKTGGYVLGGTSSSGKSGDKTQGSRGSSDYWLVKINASGAKQWDKRFGGNNEEELRSVWQTNDGGYLLGGRSGSGVSGDRTQASQGGNDYWLVKVAPQANSPVIAARQNLPAAISENLANLNALVAFPNPFAGQLNVSFTLPQTQVVSLKVYSNTGQEVATLFQGEAEATKTYTYQWQASKSTSGMYIIRLQTSQQVSHQKVLLAR
ncbi:T9SS type A sorting domain-containing protein [Adhaeribacter swui]|uniref:T9SS type A sorting domain-containing protein n=1 Tax=Adhaeribacter swui TaxID=2086471 RepID=UPI0016284488|nr:T9SS type A sorting domain-containing protein [Adhaeribacter swui]